MEFETKNNIDKHIAHIGSKHWLFQRLSAIALIPLISWFVFSLAVLGKSNFESSINFITFFPNTILFIILIFVAFWHAQLGLQVVIEDYISSKKIQSPLIFFIKSLLNLLGIVAILSILKIAFF